MLTIDQLQQIKVLGDRQKLEILRRLMACPATLSQLGIFLQETPAHIRHHLKSLEQAGLVELDSENRVRNLLERYYRATSNAYQIDLVILPYIPPGQSRLVIGSNDMALKRLQANFFQKDTAVNPLVLSLNSLEGLIKLREGTCQMATCHLLDADGTGYNRGSVRHLFPGQKMALFHMVRREEGLLVRQNNPRHIYELKDLARPDVRMINRERGSGTRVWLDDRLRRMGIPTTRLNGYQDEISSHLEVARAIDESRADAGIGLQSSARLFNLSFIPLFEEPYDLVLFPETLTDSRLAPFFDRLSSRVFRQAVEKIDGYHIPQDFGQVEFIS